MGKMIQNEVNTYMVLNREEFVTYANTVWPNLSNYDELEYGPLWISERDPGIRGNPITCTVFAQLHINNRTSKLSQTEYWDWCETVLQGDVRCFSSGEDYEWWGFTNEEDLPIWLLKWA